MGAKSDAAAGIHHDSRSRRRLRVVTVIAVVGLLGTELVLAWPSLSTALSHLRAPHPVWLIVAIVAEMTSMRAYARMQRHLLHSAGVEASVARHTALAYAAHSLSVTLPGGPAFSTRLNYRQMRRFGATPAVASWCIALTGVMSAAALAVLTIVSTVTAHGTPQWRSLTVLLAGTALITAGIRWIARHPDRVDDVIRPVLAFVNRIRRRPAGHGTDAIRTLLDQIATTRVRPVQGVIAAGYALLNWLLDAAALWLCFHAVGGGLIDANQLLLAFCAAMAVGTFTVIPGGLGIIDSALTVGLVTGGVDTAGAIATVVLYRIISFGFIVGLGWIVFLARKRDFHGDA